MQRQSARASRGYQARITPALALVFTLAALLSVLSGEAANGTTERVSVASDGSQTPYGESDLPAISGDGELVSFWSTGTLANANPYNVLAHDMTSGVTEHISVSMQGSPDGYGGISSTNFDGRFVAFDSIGTNLVPGDVNDAKDVFVRDRDSGTTELISRSSGGAHGNSISLSPSISGDGRYVAFESGASNLDPLDDEFHWSDIFLHDRTADTTQMVSYGMVGEHPRWSSTTPSVSANGRFVLFVSTNFADPWTGPTAPPVVYVFDRLSSLLEAVNVDTQGQPIALAQSYYSHSISGDGRLVTFTSSTGEIYIRDRSDGVTTLITSSQSPWAGGFRPTLSADGRFLAFRYSQTLVTLDMISGKHYQTSASNFYLPGNPGPAISGNGQRIAFASTAPLVLDDTNGLMDVFVHTLADTDADLEWDPFDPCPSNADCDGDSAVPPGYSTCIACPPGRFSDHIEVLVGTNPNGRCPRDTTANNEAVDAWPPDFNDNQIVNLSDLILMGPAYNKSVGNAGYSARFDLNTNGAVSLSDVILLGPYYNRTCVPTPLVELSKLSDGSDYDSIFSNVETVGPGVNVIYLATIDNDSSVPVTIQSLTDSLYPGFECRGPGSTPVLGIALAADNGDGTGSIDGGDDETQCTFAEVAPVAVGIEIMNTITVVVETAGGATASGWDHTYVVIPPP